MTKQLDAVLFEKHTNSLYVGIVIRKIVLDKVYLIIYESDKFYLCLECETELAEKYSNQTYNFLLKRIYRKLTKREFIGNDNDIVSILSTIIEKTK